jgi:NIPSNAP
MTSQLRMYRAHDGRLDEFVEAWRTHVKPLRERFGFHVQGAWTIPDEQRFVWILGYEGPGTFAERDTAYYASPERAALDPDPASLLAEVRTWFLTPAPPQA